MAWPSTRTRSRRPAAWSLQVRLVRIDAAQLEQASARSFRSGCPTSERDQLALQAQRRVPGSVERVAVPARLSDTRAVSVRAGRSGARPAPIIGGTREELHQEAPRHRGHSRRDAFGGDGALGAFLIYDLTATGTEAGIRDRIAHGGTDVRERHDACARAQLGLERSCPDQAHEQRPERRTHRAAGLTVVPSDRPSRLHESPLRDGRHGEPRERSTSQPGLRSVGRSRRSGRHDALELCGHGYVLTFNGRQLTVMTVIDANEITALNADPRPSMSSSTITAAS